jgi:hypothetical protein
MTDQEPLDEYPNCPICGDPIDYCQGHGDGAAGDPLAPVQVYELSQVQQGDRLRWLSDSGAAEGGTVWTDPDGRAGHVMVELDSMGGELMPVPFEVEGGLWKVGR